MHINDPETVAELQALYPRYEAALMTNDAETLTQMFWASPRAIRFGLTENLTASTRSRLFARAAPP